MNTFPFFEIEAKLESVREAAWNTIEACKNCTDNLFEVEFDNLIECQTVIRLNNHLDLISRGVDTLISDELNECASIVIRSAFESIAKIAFISLQEPKERSKTAEELLTTLSHIQNRRNKVRAESNYEFSKEFNDPFAEKVFSGIAFSDDIEASNLTKKERAKIEQRWAFTTIHAWVKNRFDELGIELGQPFSVLIYDYGMSSHMLHADGFGLDLELDNATRPFDELELKTLSEACKHYANLVTCWLVSATCTLHMLDKSVTQMSKPLEEFEHFFELILPFHDRFAVSQEYLYST